MTIRNLDYLLKPQSIALIGASRKPHSVGAVVARNLFNAGFDGPIMPVHPKERAIEGVLTYNSVEALPITPDLAIICTPPDTVPGLVAELGARGTKAAVVITAGFGELGEHGRVLQQQLLEAAKPHTLRVLGPNCLGLSVPGHGVNASFVHVTPLKGDVALVAQSGAVVTSVVDWATSRGIGFSHLISLGNGVDVDFGDLIDYLAADPGVRAILLYVEAVSHTRKFMSAARAAARQKPVVVIKAGRSIEAAKAASSHTGALAGSDEVYDAAFRRAGLLRVDELNELFDAVETLGMGIPVAGGRGFGGRLAILTNGGGIGVLATDSLIKAGGQLATLAPETLEKLDAVLPKTWSKGNPVDIIGDAGAKRYADAFSIILEDPNVDTVLVMNCPAAVADSYWAAQAVIETVGPNPAQRKRPVLTCWLGEGAAAPSRKAFSANRIPTYTSPGDAVKAFMQLVHYRRNQELLMETPPSVPDNYRPDTLRARAIIDQVLAEGRPWLSEVESKQVLDAYGIPIVKTVKVATPDEATEAARTLRPPLALKILSPDITHKSDVGGVVLRLEQPEHVHAAAVRMWSQISEALPHARLEGFAVQEMAVMSEPLELIVGMVNDRLFGPVILFGQGGTSVEVVGDKALELPPLNLNLARDLMSRTRIWKLLQGYRGRPPAALDAIANTLIMVSQLVIDFPEIQELDINPLFAAPEGVVAIDARVRVAQALESGSKRLSIRPYPKQLEETAAILDGRRFFLRPIRPEDEPLLMEMLEKMTPEDIRLRFFAPLRRLSHQAAARLTQIDYDREMGLVATAQENGRETMFGTVRIAADPDNQKAEYAVMVRSDIKGQGLGYLLMNKIIDYAQTRGIGELFGEVLRENRTMLQVCDELHFERHDHPDDPAVVEVRRRLRP